MKNKNTLTYTGLQELLILEALKNYNNSIVYDALNYLPNAKTIIDFGAGIGTLSLILRNKYKKEPICIEIDQTNIEYLYKRNFAVFQNIEDLSQTVDLIISSNVLEHIEDDYKILTSLRNKLNDDGILFLYLPANMILWTKLDEIVGHYRRYEISKLKILIKKAGFKLITIHYADFLGFFITLLWKFLNNINNKSLPSKFILSFFDRFIFPLSRTLDKLGLRHLIGKNIILVAKKDIKKV